MRFPPGLAPSRAFAIALSLQALLSARAFAQCPEGTPPPCKGASRTAIPVRRANPPLNARAWIVVPFGNVMKAQELDWLRDASVNLLSMDMSRWSDINVVPDKRVGDLLNELPARDGSRPLTLNDGLAVARRAGAGMLVMGDFFRVGKGARIVANVFDVRTGAKLRSATHETTDQDSLLTAFTPLARGVLDVPPPPDARTGDLGTSSLDAYQEYLLGDRALNRFDLAGARKHLTRALELDSTFALAHLRLSYALGWGEQSITSAEGRAHALAARRLGGKLPPRARALIAGEIATVDADYGAACDAYGPLVAHDSSDVEALYLYGDCSFHDNFVRLSSSDTTRGVFRSSWNTAIRLLKRALELDPNYDLAYEHILDILRTDQRVGCVRIKPADPCGTAWAMPLRDNDTLVTIAVRDIYPSMWSAEVEKGARENSHVANLFEARRFAQRWVDAEPSEGRAHFGLARVLMALGRLPEADAQLHLTPSDAQPENLLTLRARLEVAAKLGRGAEARAFFDSVVKAVPDVPGVLLVRGTLELAFGRMARMRTGWENRVRDLGPDAVAYFRDIPRIYLGVPIMELAREEAAYYTLSAKDISCATACRLDAVYASLVYALGTPRTVWPAFGTAAETDEYLRPARALAAGDTATVRRYAFLQDSLAHRNIRVGWSDDGRLIIAAQAYLALHDTTTALRMARYFVDSAMAVQTLQNAVGSGSAFWPRMMLLRADLAAATGSPAEAVLWYDRVLDLWANADPELQPVIQRIRTARAALASSRR